MSADNVPIYNIGNAPVVIPVVLPVSADRAQSGSIRNVPVHGKVDTSGWLVWNEGEDDEPGEWLVSPVKKGYRHLRDYYMEEHNPEGWATYKRYLRDWAKKLTTQPFPPHLLPKQVQAMQQGLVAADKPDPWLVQAAKPTTGRLADVPKPDADAANKGDAPAAPKGSKGPQ